MNPVAVYGRSMEVTSVATPCAPDRAQQIASLATAADAPEIAGEAERLVERLAEARFYVACVGQFKRGKSTLLNAFVERPILPAGVVPITTAVTVLRFGPAVRARVRIGTRWQDIGIDEIGAYVSEEHNPANAKGATLVEVFVPSPLLASGMCLVDTPGIGSVIAANTEATHAFVPHIDVALVVVGADPPISGEELDLIDAIHRQVPHLLVVLSKADRLTAQDRAEAIAFTRRVLAERLGRRIGHIYEVSASERLGGAERTRDWAALEDALTHLATTGSADMLRAAEERGTALLAQRLLYEIDEQRDALLRPREESERRVAAMRTCAADAQQALLDLGYLLTAEQERLSRAFAERGERFLAEALPGARAELARALGEMKGARSAVRQQALRWAQQTATQWVDQWLAEVAPAAEALYREGAERFARLANEFLGRLAASDDLFAGLPREVRPDVGFRTASRLYYTELLHFTLRSPLQWLLDLLRPPAMARRTLEREVGGYLAQLLTANATRVRNDLDERVFESRLRMEGEIREYLRLVCESAERALERARAHRAAGGEAVEAELERLDELRQQVHPLTGGDRPQPVTHHELIRAARRS